ncbi:hypothetical protein Dtox_1169 [Desulfofarcimen acetoxidans DSM 771]|uniref:Vacuolar-type H+-ATPase subunit H n=1 Tax=Desulfofarcimen acetoxidans (strain ATCC 49208 / DSM 771 / KCTC 5769 / VKM B-1644 / 5575) TaxID=485916 RepID=C8W572_DESAS|nr:hypothetical protein [Desulfofarcimen acetoxidans]ACV62054.1 hypothetical protein Dtox_1169 [Desulfofarcimen acetoxidans DSM 771]
MELFNVLNELEELIESSTKIPFSRKVLVDEEKVLDYLDRIRAVLPEEVRQAKWVVQEREKVLSDTKKEASKLIENAQKQVMQQADESEIVQQSRIIAEEIVEQSKMVSQEMREGARIYADDILKGLEDNLGKLLNEIQQGRLELQGIKKETGY